MRRWWLIPVGLVALVFLALPAVAVVDVPGEQRVKEALGMGRPTDFGKWPQCGDIRSIGENRPPWRQEPSLPEPRDEMRAVRFGDSIYLVGGLADLDIREVPASAKSVSGMWRFDLRTGKYEDMPSLPRRLNHMVAVGWHGDIYTFGGHTDKLETGEAVTDAYRYRVAEKRWEKLAPMPTARGAHGVAVVGDKAYVVGGRNAPRTRLNTMDVYDFRTGEWSAGRPMRVARDHLAVGEHEGKIYVLGGREFGDYSLGTFERYDPERDRWEALPDHPQPVSSMALEWLGDRFVIPMGGHAAPEPAWITGDVYTYDPDSEEWGKLPSAHVPRHGYAHAVVGDRLYTFGGSACGTFEDSARVDSLQVRPQP
jgi:Kelch motif